MNASQDTSQHNSQLSAQLPFLIRLMDDPSPTVRARVTLRLREMGRAAWSEIERQNITLSEEQTQLLSQILHAEDDDALRRAWPEWLMLDDAWDQLEEALNMLARWQLGADYPVRLSELLDELAEEYLYVNGANDPIGLSHFLFEIKGLRGADAADIYNPLNSNLIHVIQQKRGIPMSLANVFMLVGRRLGMEIHGCNFPGHFLARAEGEDGDDWVFDCFEGGRLLSRAEVAALRKAAARELASAASAPLMVSRVLRNMANAFYQSGEEEKTRFMLSLLHDLEEYVEHS